MRLALALLIGVSTLLTYIDVAQAQEAPAGLSLRQEIMYAHALAQSDPVAAREALQRVVTRLSSGGETVASAGPAEYAVVADLVSRLEMSIEVRASLAGCWVDRVSSDESFRAGMRSGPLLKLGQLVKASQPQRLDAVVAVVEQRMDLLRQASSQSPLTPSSSAPSVVVLCDLLEARALGGESSSTVSAQWVQTKLQELTTTQNGRFLKELAPFEIIRLADYYTAVGQSDVAERLRGFVVRQYLAEAGIAAALRLSDWSELLGVVSGSSDGALRRGMVALAVGRAGASLQGAPREMAAGFLRGVEQAGGTAEEMNALAARWMGVEPGSADVAAIRALLDAADDQAVRVAMMATMKQFGDDREAMAAAVEAAVADRDQAVTVAMKSLRDRHDTGKLDAAGYALACRLARESGSAAATEFWSLAAMERFLKSTGNGDDSLALLEAAALNTDAKLTKETAEKLLARLGDFRDDSWRISDATLQSLARAFDKAGMAETLYKSISLPDGSGPDFIAVKLLAWIRRDQKQIRPFIGELAAPTEKTQGDTRARWELARAYAVSLVEPRAPRRTDGNGHIRLALQASRSDQTLLMCLEELVAASRPTNSYTFPLQIITSTKDRFDGDTRRRIEAIEQQLRSAMPTANAAEQSNWQSIFDQKRQQMQRG